MNGTHRGRGLTLTETLVVIAIVGILLALIVPAVMAVRLASQRALCQSRLRDLGTAMHSYHEVNHQLPAAFYVFNPAQPGIPYASVHVHLMAFVDANIHDSLNYTAIWVVPNYLPPSVRLQNQTVARKTIQAILCPSDGGVGSNFEFGQCNFRGNAGLNRIPYARGIRDGVFWAIRAVRFGEMRDGMSATAAFSEKLKGDGASWPVDSTRDWLFANSLGNRFSDSTALVQACSTLSLNAPHDSYAGSTWMYTGGRFTLYTHDLPPNARDSDCGYIGTYPEAGVYTPRSSHGSTNVLFCDGSVRPIVDGIDATVWKSMGTRAGNEGSAAQ